MSNGGEIPTNEINMPKLFSDVSHTLNGFKNLFIPSARTSDAEVAAHYDIPSLSNTISDIFSGNVCFKACGMEDIQLAAQKASELFVTVRYCIITLTVFAIICMLLLSVVLAWYFLKTTLIFDGRSGLPIQSTFTGTSSMFTHSRYQKTRSPTPTRENLRK
uniref:Protein tweety homolog n=1 Tax=Elaeophora elaphi TaxID=1147741 RepID=A0A0R3RUC8_9BILA